MGGLNEWVKRKIERVVKLEGGSWSGFVVLL